MEPSCVERSKLMLRASFVVPVYNSDTSIGACVESIAKQEHSNLINEVILVDDGSTDSSAQVMKELKQKYADILNIRLIHNKVRHYVAYARNRGFEIGTGDLVFFIDSDIVLPSNYLVTHTWIHQQNTTCITFSLRSDVNCEMLADIAFPITETDEFRSNILSSYNNLQTASFQFDAKYSLADMCLTCAVTYRRSDLQFVKGCPENFKGWGFNDTAMASKVIARGRSVIPALDCTVYHISHAPRSGNIKNKQAEYLANKQRYANLLQMPLEETLAYSIDSLDFVRI